MEELLSWLMRAERPAWGGIERSWFRVAGGMRGEYWRRWRRILQELAPSFPPTTYLSPIRSKESALRKPKSPVWMTAVASCSRINRLSSWSECQYPLPSRLTALTRHSQSPRMSATQRIRALLPPRTIRGDRCVVDCAGAATPLVLGAGGGAI